MILFEPRALADLERIFDFNADAFDSKFALEQLRSIQSAIQILNLHPRIGRPVRGSSMRELVISNARRTGFIALYDYDEHERLVRVVGIRHQREAGFRR